MSIIIVFGLAWPTLKHTIYHSRGEHANNYTTSAVQRWLCSIIDNYHITVLSDKAIPVKRKNEIVIWPVTRRIKW